ncbi:glycerol-3-phosphate acyltransferase, chloroplastic isoform X2 [Arachis ipaensis]|uniref:glycerol-3-phosphate acyltransferase, chloroplastic isoform X2 n=1 Tax=Arachis ipaensis TaxID=130454 RepID=UPI000A2AF79F|nr:glycerol-3-phosphate acyltransferase, chloroplastic isoform X2 [Arachis ipaensis]
MNGSLAQRAAQGVFTISTNASSSHSQSPFPAFFVPRVSSFSSKPPPPPSCSSSSVYYTSCSCYCASSLYSFKPKIKAQDYLASPPKMAAVSTRTFLNARSEQELLSGIKKEAQSGNLPAHVAAGMEEVYKNYKSAVVKSGNPKADEIVLSNMSAFLDRISLDVSVRNSYVGNMPLFTEMEERLKKGHNIILMSNHQTEADPAVIALLIEKKAPHLAENMIYVAGDRVVTDPMCKPFSIGRNLICVYSKKHMLDDPSQIEMKKKANTRSLKEMAVLLRGGSQLIWIAPSGGRDRTDPKTGEFVPAPFDPASVDNMRRLVENSGPPGHIYPMALLCYDIMPPPATVEKKIGEKRIISFHGTALSVTPPISFPASGKPEQAKDDSTKVLYDSVTEQYTVLKAAVHGKKGLQASTPKVSLSQPWN